MTERCFICQASEIMAEQNEGDALLYFFCAAHISVIEHGYMVLADLTGDLVLFHRKFWATTFTAPMPEENLIIVASETLETLKARSGRSLETRH